MKKTLLLILVFSNSFLALADEEILNFIKKYNSSNTINLVDSQVNKDDLNTTHLTEISELYCSGDFTTISKGIGLLNSLTILNLSNSSLEELPSEINSLTNLTRLYLNNNRLKKVPNIESLTNLREVYLNNNNLVEIPKGIENICSSFKSRCMPPPPLPLESCILDISNNRLSYLPKEIANIKGFGCDYSSDSKTSLKLSGNFYTKIPNSFKNMEVKTEFSDGSISDCSIYITKLGYEFFDLDMTYSFDTNKSISFEPILGDDFEIESYLWLFGDDTNSTKENPTHTYEEFGEYNITLILNHNLSDKKEYKASKTIYIYPRVKEFKKGWNLVTTPTSDDINRTLFDEVWSYKDYTWHSDDKFLTPTKGYWVKVKSDFNLSFNGNSYPLFDSKIELDWNLLGSGEMITTFDKNLTYYVYRDNYWIKNPKKIDAGEGVWIYKPLTPQERLINFIKKKNGKKISDLSKVYDIRFSSLDYLPKEIKYLTNLQSFGIYGSNIEKFPKELFDLTTLTFLSISGAKLEKVPKEIGNLVNLEKLYLSGNRIEELPKEIGNLVNLKTLFLEYNKIEKFPEEIGNLKKLKTLFLIQNKITQIGNLSKLTNLDHLTLTSNEVKNFDGIGNLKNLTNLGLSKNKLKELPSEIGELINLKNFDLSFNLLDSIPYEVANLISLKNLELSFNIFKELPIELTNIPNLEVLFLKNNQISKIPSEIKNLQKLKYLNIKGNELKELPVEIAELSNLSQLSIDNNPIKELPEEIKNMPNLDLRKKQ